MFTKTHYKVMARCIKKVRTDLLKNNNRNEANKIVDNLVRNFCRDFEQDNERFDADKFAEACQLEA
jgi:hypothetical protein